MTNLEKIYMIFSAVVSGIAIYYIRKSNRLEKDVQSREDSIEILCDYIDSMVDKEVSRILEDSEND